MIRLVVLGPPRTKKTHARIIRNRKTGAPQIIPAKTSMDWEKNAIGQLQRQHTGTVHQAYSVSVRALVYRDANRGDLCGYLQAIGDALQGGGSRKKRVACVLVDDAQIKSFDGSRLLIDRKNPRVEIELTPMVESGEL